jgi:hypothetical protein
MLGALTSAARLGVPAALLQHHAWHLARPGCEQVDHTLFNRMMHRQKLALQATS